jgi:hypothetical protein
MFSALYAPIHWRYLGCLGLCWRESPVGCLRSSIPRKGMPPIRRRRNDWDKCEISLSSAEAGENQRFARTHFNIKNYLSVAALLAAHQNHVHAIIANASVAGILRVNSVTVSFGSARIPAPNSAEPPVDKDGAPGAETQTLTPKNI